MQAVETLWRAATVVRTGTLVVALAAGTSVVALHEFDRAWGVVPLGGSTLQLPRTVSVESVDSSP